MREEPPRRRRRRHESIKREGNGECSARGVLTTTPANRRMKCQIGLGHKEHRNRNCRRRCRRQEARRVNRRHVMLLYTYTYDPNWRGGYCAVWPKQPEVKVYPGMLFCPKGLRCVENVAIASNVNSGNGPDAPGRDNDLFNGKAVGSSVTMGQCEEEFLRGPACKTFEFKLNDGEKEEGTCRLWTVTGPVETKQGQTHCFPRPCTTSACKTVGPKEAGSLKLLFRGTRGGLFGANTDEPPSSCTERTHKEYQCPPSDTNRKQDLFREACSGKGPYLVVLRTKKRNGLPGGWPGLPTVGGLDTSLVV